MDTNPENTAPVARGFIPAELRSSSKKFNNINLTYLVVRLGAAARPSGDKSPRHKCCIEQKVSA
ncbi:hypothetical protein [Pseudomonas sp. D1-1]|uniref:hypothetical protein n=1 Tax=Pseudomonas sp. D1-1 TaxID=1040793 RepID=UPI003DA80A18